MADREYPPIIIAKRPGNISGNRARNIMSLCRLLHSRGNIDRTSVNPNRTLGVALFADYDLAAMDPNSEGWNDAKPV